MHVAGENRLPSKSNFYSGARSQRDFNIVARANAELATVETILTIEEVRAALSGILGSLSQDVIASAGIIDWRSSSLIAGQPYCSAQPA
jgi:hypothetical protein